LQAQKRLAVIYLGLDIFGQNEPPVITPDADTSVKYLKYAPGPLKGLKDFMINVTRLQNGD